MRSLVRGLLDRLPYVGTLREQLRNQGAFPAGHFYSPIPDVRDIAERFQRLPPRHDSVPGVHLNLEGQLETLRALHAFYAELPFREQQQPDLRYYFDQTVFCYADAIFLYSMLRHTQPRHIIEVGSGFSSAVILDTIDRFFTTRPALTFIEPFPVNLKRLLRSQDQGSVTLIEDKVQHVPIDRFATLQAGDLLFIDSSHVLKCGSDVQYLLFEIIPRLPAGVFVHFHDVFDGFEYPREWLKQGWYWNEDYLLRAFLSFNSAWEIFLFGNHVVTNCADWFKENMPLCLKNPGGSLYLRRVTA